MKYNIPFIKPSFPTGTDIGADYDKIVASNWFTNFGPYEQSFRKQIGDFIGQEVKVATAANATLAIDLAVRALFKRTDTRQQVIVPSFTFAAGPEVLISQGFTPVFIDIEEDSWQPSIVQADEYIATHADTLAGILLCNTFGVGNPAVVKWEELATKYDLPIIIDSAAGLGSKYTNSTYIGARGDCEIFSLHATKPFAVGEGGLIVSKRPELVEDVMALQNFGFDGQRNITAIGTNAKLQELSCAIGLRQLENFAARLSDRQSSLSVYKESLSKLGYSFQTNDHLSTVAFVSVIAPSETIGNEVYERLLSSGIEAKRYYRPLHEQKIFKDKVVIASSLDVTNNIAARIISLPLHDNMSEALISSIVRTMEG